MSSFHGHDNRAGKISTFLIKISTVSQGLKNKYAKVSHKEQIGSHGKLSRHRHGSK